MTAERWGRLQDDLAAAGITTTVTERRYTDGNGHGVSRSILFRTTSGHLLTIVDTAWSKNLDVWTGYEVTVENRDDIIIHTSRRTKKRSDVVATVTMWANR